MTFTEKSIRLPNAVTLRYVEQGPADGIPVILLHGYPDSWRSFAPVMEHLPGRLRVIALSQRGFGDSDRPLGNYHPRDLAADLAEFMVRLDIPDAYVVGHSMGSYVAEYLALDHPARVRGLILVGTFRTLARSVDLTHMADALSRMEKSVEPDFVRDFQLSTLAQAVPDAFLETVVAESAKVPLHVWRSALKALMAVQVFGQLGQIRAPTVIFWGDRDSMSKLYEQHAVAQAIPAAQLWIYAAAGHSPHWEQPKRFARDLAEFVAGCEQMTESISAPRRLSR